MPSYWFVFTNEVLSKLFYGGLVSNQNGIKYAN